MGSERLPRDAKGPSALGAWFMRALFAVVLLMGVSSFVSGSGLLARGTDNVPGAVTAILMGAILSGLAVTYLYVSFVRAPRENARLAALRTNNPGEPWLERPDWSARRVNDTTAGTAVFLWIWTIGWCGLLAFIASVNHDKIVSALAQSWWNVAVAVVFGLTGLAGLWLATNHTWAWLRYGTSTLLIDTLPGYLGDTFRATLITRIPRQTMPLEVELICEEIRWVRRGNGKYETTSAETTRKGSARATVDPMRIVIAGNEARITISVTIPADLPPCDLDDRGNGIRWRLEIATAAGEQPFACTFEVPVYARNTQP